MYESVCWTDAPILTTHAFACFTVTKQYPMLIQTFRKKKTSMTARKLQTFPCLLIHITVPAECEKKKHVLTHLRYSDGEILIFPRYCWCSPERCCPRLMSGSVCMCVCSVASVLLLGHVDTALPPVSASGLHFCRLGRLPDSCFGIALRLLFPSF